MVGTDNRLKNRGPAAAKSPPGMELAEYAGDSNFMASLARGLLVLEALSARGGSMSVAEVSRTISIPRAAVRRCLYTLDKLGYVEPDARGFALGPKILSLGHTYSSSSQLTLAAQPLLDRVSAEVQESCSLATLSGDEIVYVARSAASQRIMSIDISVGSRLSAFCTSMGRVLLAHLPSEQRQARLERAKLIAFTERTVTSREKLRQILNAVKRGGFAVVDQELEIGLRSIAVPVRDSAGRVTAAMNVGTQAARFSLRDLESKLLPPLRKAADELSALLH